MAEPTEADRSRAAHIVANWTVNFSPDQPNALENMISTYLADERERARAPFLALVEEFDGHISDDGDWGSGRESAFAEAADRIRRAAEETGQ